MNQISQGDILKIERINAPVLVVSKDFFNRAQEIIACPILGICSRSPLHIEIETNEIQGYVQCEKMKHLDMRVRGYKKIDHISMADLIDITDAIQSIFDYI